MSFGPRHRINDFLPRKWRDFNGIKGSFIHDWLDFVVYVRTIINAFSVFITRGKRSSSAHEKQRGWQREEGKKSIGIIYLPLLLSWARIKSDTTEPICLECEIHLISSPGLFQSHKSKKLMFAVSFQETVFPTSYSHLVSVSLLTALTNLITSINRGKKRNNWAECFLAWGHKMLE